MKHQKRRPLTKRVIKCVEKFAFLQYINERTYVICPSSFVGGHLHCNSRQLARAVYALRRAGKLARWDGDRTGILELVPQGEWARRAEWFTRDTLELLDRWEVDEIDQLLRLKQRVDVDRI
jgi:hypothetical protein